MRVRAPKWRRAISNKREGSLRAPPTATSITRWRRIPAAISARQSSRISSGSAPAGAIDNNRRTSEYNLNPQFAGFVANELVPAIDVAYRTSATADDRVILGTSLGGLNSAYFGATQSGAFHKIAIQSPAFSFNPSIYPLYDQPPQAPLEIFMTAGTISDGNGGVTMNGILAENGYDFTFTQANEGHSWGNWRGQLAGLLTVLVGPAPQPPGDYNGDGTVDAADFTQWRDTLGQVAARGQGADGNNNGAVDASDYQVWKNHFGATYNVSGGQAGGSVGVPEPASGSLLSAGLAIGIACRGYRAALSRNSSCRCAAERRQLRGLGWRSSRNMAARRSVHSDL